jgi:excisionase family DNA binding protein
MLTIDEVAKRLNTSERHVRLLLDRGDLASVKVGRLIRVPEADLDAFLAANRRPVAASQRDA